MAGTADGSSPGTWWELQPTKRWAALAWPLTAFLDGVALDSAADRVLVEVLDAVDLSALIGTRVYLGYGLDADEMLAAGRYRLIYEVSAGRP